MKLIVDHREMEIKLSPDNCATVRDKSVSDTLMPWIDLIRISRQMVRQTDFRQESRSKGGVCPLKGQAARFQRVVLFHTLSRGVTHESATPRLNSW